MQMSKIFISPDLQRKLIIYPSLLIIPATYAAIQKEYIYGLVFSILFLIFSAYVSQSIKILYSDRIICADFIIFKRIVEVKEIVDIRYVYFVPKGSVGKYHVKVEISRNNGQKLVINLEYFDHSMTKKFVEYLKSVYPDIKEVDFFSKDYLS